MSDIFLSYARDDRPTAERLAAELESHGWSVWWDRRIPAGERFEDVIEQAIDTARCVIVLWSATSVKSDWVKDEAGEGKARGVLVPVLIEDVKIPLAFRRIHAAKLIGWPEEPADRNLELLIEDVSRLLGPPKEGRNPRNRGNQRTTAKAKPPVRHPLSGEGVALRGVEVDVMRRDKRRIIARVMIDGAKYSVDYEYLYGFLSSEEVVKVNGEIVWSGACFEGRCGLNVGEGANAHTIEIEPTIGDGLTSPLERFRLWVDGELRLDAKR